MRWAYVICEAPQVVPLQGLRRTDAFLSKDPCCSLNRCDRNCPCGRLPLRSRTGRGRFGEVFEPGGVLLTLPTRGISGTLTQDLMPGKMVIACLGRGILIMIYRAFYGGRWNSSSGPDLLFCAFGSFSSIGNKYATRGVVSHTCCVPLPVAPYQALIFLQLRFKENLSRYQNFKVAGGLPNPQVVFNG